MEEETQKANEKKQIEREHLSTIAIVHTIEELQKEIDNINSGTIPGKEKKKLKFLNNQVRVRNRLLGKENRTRSQGG